MDKEEKKRIANEKRLRAVKEWSKNSTLQKINVHNTHKVFDTNTTIYEENKSKVQDSDYKEHNFEEIFAIRPQYDEFGKDKMSQMNSQKFKLDDGSSRFKWDERFKDDELADSPTVENKEKEKNLQILQDVIGHKVFSRASQKSSSKKRQIRYDPEDESSSKYVKLSETPIEKSKKQKSKKITVAETEEPSIPVSTERYIEVSSNLKEILSSSSTPFSFSQKFSHDDKLDIEEFSYKSDVPDTDIINEEEIKIDHLTKEEEKQSRIPQELGSRSFISKLKCDSFFVLKGDPRLKEGIEFFRRTRPLEDIREEWLRDREHVLDLFRRKRRSAMRYRVTKVKDVQRKNAIRKQNFKT